MSKKFLAKAARLISRGDERSIRISQLVRMQGLQKQQIYAVMRQLSERRGKP